MSSTLIYSQIFWVNIALCSSYSCSYLLVF